MRATLWGHFAVSVSTNVHCGVSFRKSHNVQTPKTPQCTSAKYGKSDRPTDLPPVGVFLAILYTQTRLHVLHLLVGNLKHKFKKFNIQF